jgi:hypothetical protein
MECALMQESLLLRNNFMYFMKSTFLILFISSSVYSQTIFQKDYGFNSFVQDANGLFIDSDSVNILLQVGNCVVNNEPNQIGIGILKTDLEGRFGDCNYYHSITCDTSFSISDFKKLNNSYLISGNLYTSTISKSMFINVDDLGLVQGKCLKYKGRNSLLKLEYNQLSNSKYGVIITDTVFNGSYNSASILIKLDSSFNIVFSKLIKAPFGFEYTDFVLSDSGTIIASGFMKDTANVFIQIVNVFDTMGNSISNQYYRTVAGHTTTSKMLIKNQQLYISGTKVDTVTGNFGLYMVNMDFNGNINWCKHYNFDGGAEASLQSVGMNDILIASNYFNSNLSSFSLNLMRIDSDGIPLWSSLYDTTIHPAYNYYITETDSAIYSVALLLKGFSSIPIFNLYLIKSDKTGISGCHETSLQIPYNNYIDFIPINYNVVLTDYWPSIDTFTLVHDSISLVERTFCSSLVGINEFYQSESMDVFPNPFYDFVNVSLNYNSSDLFIVSLYDIWGGLVFSKDQIRIQDITHISNLKFIDAGVYTLVLSSINHRTICKKLVHIP